MIASIEFPGGASADLHPGRWESSDKFVSDSLNTLYPPTDPRWSSPAVGAPGHALAHHVADRYGGRVTYLIRPAPVDPNRVY